MNVCTYLKFSLKQCVDGNDYRNIFSTLWSTTDFRKKFWRIKLRVGRIEQVYNFVQIFHATPLLMKKKIEKFDNYKAVWSYYKNDSFIQYQSFKHNT